MSESLTDEVAALLTRAADSAVDEPAETALRSAAASLAEPLRLAIAGKVKAGKSTLLNSLVGEELAPTDAGECTRIVTWYRWGEQPRVVIHPRDGEPEGRPYTREGGALQVDLGRRRSDEVDHMDVWWPSRRLQTLTLVDTPGLASLSTDLSATTHQLLAADGEHPSAADAVVYLLRHAHASDIRFLEAFHGDEIARGTPMNAIGVLSRADEIGSARGDALEVAKRVSARYRADPRVHKLCPVVVPVTGLLAQAGATLREHEFRALSAVAALPRDDATSLMLTADRFAHSPTKALVSDVERQHLLSRLGLFGVRLSVTLIRSRLTTDATQLAAELTRRSGIVELHGILDSQFTARSRVLKARSGLVVLKTILQRGGCDDAAALRSQLEQVEASAHAFVEVRTLNALRNGELSVKPDVFVELERLLGGHGHAPAVRLKLAPTADRPAVDAAAREALSVWHRRAEHPLSGRPERTAARIATRTLEGILAGSEE